MSQRRGGAKQQQHKLVLTYHIQPQLGAQLVPQLLKRHSTEEVWSSAGHKMVLTYNIPPQLKLGLCQTWRTADTTVLAARLQNVQTVSKVGCTLTYDIQPQLGAQLIPERVVGVVAAPHRVEVQLLHQPDVLRMMHFRMTLGYDLQAAAARHRVEVQLLHQPDVLHQWQFADTAKVSKLLQLMHRNALQYSCFISRMSCGLRCGWADNARQVRNVRGARARHAVESSCFIHQIPQKQT